MPVFGGPHRGFAVKYLLDLDRHEPLGRWVVRIGQYPAAPRHLFQGMNKIPVIRSVIRKPALKFRFVYRRQRPVPGMFGQGFALELDKEGRLRAGSRHKFVHAFYKQWHRPVRWRGGMRVGSDILEAQVTNLKNTYLRNDEYRPFRFRW